MLNILTIIGARPQFIKSASLSLEFKNHPDINEVVVHTGQHFDQNMSKIFFEQMLIPIPKYNLNINSLSHGAMTGRMIEEIEKLLIIENPNFVLVYGDTNSTLAGAIAAKKLQIKVIHVEAGLRSYNMNMPEEVNRVLTDRISDVLFCPSAQSIKNLELEGFNNYDCNIFNSGDVMKDGAIFYEKYADERTSILEGLNIMPNNYYLCTIHREENMKNLNKFLEIISGLNNLSEKYKIILPIHPRTNTILKKFEINDNIKIIDPTGYLDMIYLIKNARIVITDSGGLQKEAYFFGTFCITLRKETEWVELVEQGYNELVGSNAEKIKKAVKKFENKSFNKDLKLYGDGNACKKIVKNLREMLKKNEGAIFKRFN